MKGILLSNGQMSIVELDNDLNSIKKALKITGPVDCVERKFGGDYVDMWIDDEGKLKINQPLTIAQIIDNKIVDVIVGNVLILNHTKGGNCKSLTQQQIDSIMKEKQISIMDYMFNQYYVWKCFY